MEREPITPLLTVSEEEFLAYTFAWRSTEKKPDWLGIFFISDKVIPGYYFYQEHMMDLLSVPGVTSIKIRFGIRTNFFVLLMFGTDNAEERRTPYFIVDELIPEASEETSGDEGIGTSYQQGNSASGNVPDVLASTWISNWSRVKPTKFLDNYFIPINISFFETHYGLLQGYNYSVTEIIDTLYKKSNNNFPVVLIRFALHKYIHFDPAVYYSSRKEKMTFGLIFHPTDKLNSPNGSKTALGFAESTNRGDGDAVYYDLTMPCPRTC